ncbi:MAG: hypothetical protein COA99_13625 [Moraxellaceae bacterium]|nr:MAG: hypothetical protein COA99_13625 [Moraxellaceae bacterium]
MIFRLKIALIFYSINVLGMIGIGCLYVFGNEFMPYHSDIIQTSWVNVGANEKILYLGMMRTEGAGFLACALAIVILLAIPFREGRRWSYWAIPIIGIAEYLPTLIATYHVSTITNATPPWPAVLSGCVLFLVGLVLTVVDNNENQEAESSM